MDKDKKNKCEELYKKGNSHESNDKNEEAIQCYSEAIKLDENYKWAYRNRGRVYRKQGEFEKAIADYRKAIQIDDNYVGAYNSRGLVYYDLGRYEEAINDYSKAIKLDENYKWAYRNRGKVYREQGEFEKAIADYTKAIQIDDNYLDAYNSRGLVYYDLGRYEEAINDYSKAIKLDENYKWAYRSRGLAYKKQGKYEKAIADYRKAIQIDDNYVDAYNSRGLVYYDLGRYEEAINDYSKAIKLDENYKWAYRNRGLAYKKQEKYEKAIADYTKAIQIDDNYANAYNSRGVIYKNQGNNKQALADYTKTIEIDGKNKFAHYNIGLIYYEQKKYTQAIEKFTKALEVDPQYESALTYRRLSYNKIGNEKENKKDQEKLIEVKDKVFYKYVKESKIDNEIKIEIYDLYFTVMELKNILLYKNYKEVGHYTKIGNIKHLLKPNDKENSDAEKTKARLRLNNVAYMNDPTEGEVFLTLLNKYNDKEVSELLDIIYKNKDENFNGREVLNGKNHVFLVSFSNAVDRLPMWVQYADNGKGACIVFNSSFFDEEDKNPFSHMLNEDCENLSENENDKDIDYEVRKEKYYCLHQIKYIDVENNNVKDNNFETIKKLITEIGKKLAVFSEALQKEENSLIKEIIQNIIDQVRFLFKDISYDHEEEVRLVKFEDNGNVKYTGDAEGFIVPHVYIEMDTELDRNTINEVILGPKVENTTEVANYLYYTDKVNMVTRSKIKYK